MSILYERLEMLCNAKGITGYRLCKDIGASPNLMTELRTGRRNNVSAKTLSLIAKYFDVSTDYLIGNEEPSEEHADVLLQKLRDEDRALLEVAKGMSPEQVRMMTAFAKALKGNSDD